MNPKRTCKYLDDYIDGELSPSLNADFEQHLDSCAACGAAVEETKKMEHLLRDAWNRVELEQSDSRIAREVRTARELEPTNTYRHRLELVAALAASVLIVVGLAWYSLRKTDPIAEVDPQREIDQTEESESSENSRPLRLGNVANHLGEYQMSYASAQFDGMTDGLKIATNPQFTVYQVVPKVTFRQAN